jgi:tRNA(Ile)-lysidine synthase
VPAVDLLPRCRFPEAGTDVTCAVSGGADSLALLVLAVEAGCCVTAVHVDHGLRDGSAEEAAVVAAAARRFGAASRAERAHIGPGPNLEARARAARYAVLPPGVLTGHTADDQAETILLNLLRGAGVEGLAGMRTVPAPGTDGPWRPLLELRRSETHALCRELGLEPVEDESNADPAFRRNRIRHELLPLAADVAGRDVVPILCRQAGLLREVGELLGGLAGAVDPTAAKELATANPALARVAVRAWLQTETGSEHPADAGVVERVLAVARGEVRGAEVGGGWRVSRTAGRLRAERA